MFSVFCFLFFVTNFNRWCFSTLKCNEFCLKTVKEKTRKSPRIQTKLGVYFGIHDKTKLIKCVVYGYNKWIYSWIPKKATKKKKNKNGHKIKLFRPCNIQFNFFQYFSLFLFSWFCCVFRDFNGILMNKWVLITVYSVMA